MRGVAGPEPNVELLAKAFLAFAEGIPGERSVVGSLPCRSPVVLLLQPHHVHIPFVESDVMLLRIFQHDALHTEQPHP